MRSFCLTVALSLAATAACAGGLVNVTFVDPDHYYDAGNSKHDVPANLRTIEQHLEDLGQRYLADGQVLDVAVLDIDLAGYTRPTPQGIDLRVARGGTDWPSFKLRYTLRSGDVQVKAGEEVVADMAYGRHGQIQVYSSRDPLRYEKQMLEGWLRSRFTADY